MNTFLEKTSSYSNYSLVAGLGSLALSAGFRKLQSPLPKLVVLIAGVVLLVLSVLGKFYKNNFVRKILGLSLIPPPPLTKNPIEPLWDVLKVKHPANPQEYYESRMRRVISDPEKIKQKIAKENELTFRNEQNLNDKENHSWGLNLSVSSAAEESRDSGLKLCQVGISNIPSIKNEDRHITESFTINLAGKTYPIHLFGVFDGHGGSLTSSFLQAQFRRHLEFQLQFFNKNEFSDANVWNALKMTYVALHYEVSKAKGNKPRNQTGGSTSSVAMILDGKLWTANAGDSRTVLSNNGEAIALSRDQKPNENPFKSQVERRQGMVIFYGTWRVQGDLAMARSIGDEVIRAEGVELVLPRPKITCFSLYDLRPGSRLIIGSDGLWDAASTRQIVNTVHHNKDKPLGNLAEAVAKNARAIGSRDDITVIVVNLDLLLKNLS